MTLSVQVCGCHEEDGEVCPFVPDSEADYYGVYIGEAGDFMWCADFKSKDDALNWAEEVAACHDCEVDDKTRSDSDE